MTSTIANRPSIPPGFRLKADGSYVPEALVSDIDKLRDQTIETLIDRPRSSARCWRTSRCARFAISRHLSRQALSSTA